MHVHASDVIIRLNIYLRHRFLRVYRYIFYIISISPCRPFDFIVPHRLRDLYAGVAEPPHFSVHPDDQSCTRITSTNSNSNLLYEYNRNK